jgi:hypothetical protein
MHMLLALLHRVCVRIGRWLVWTACYRPLLLPLPTLLLLLLLLLVLMLLLLLLLLLLLMLLLLLLLLLLLYLPHHRCSRCLHQPLAPCSASCPRSVHAPTAQPAPNNKHTAAQPVETVPCNTLPLSSSLNWLLKAVSPGNCTSHTSCCNG